MEDLFKQLILTSPGLFAAIFLTGMFLRHLKARDTDAQANNKVVFEEMKSMRDRELDEMKMRQDRDHGVIKENTVAISESSNASREMRKAVEKLTEKRTR